MCFGDVQYERQKLLNAREWDSYLCCCNHRPFCNYDPALRKKVEKVLRYCKYNSGNQFLFNDLYLVVREIGEACLLHYIDNTTLQDMDLRLPKRGTVLYQQPGSGFSPIDFSYALLEEDQCRFIEVEPLSNITSCAEYESPTMILNGSETVYVKHTSYCYTEMRLEFWKNGDVKYSAKGGAATRAMVDENRLYLDHIAYAAYDLAGRADMPACVHFRGDPESEISKSRAICFCRWFKHRSEPCNEQQEERAKAMALLFHEESFHRLHLTHSSALEFFMDKMEDLWCHYRRMFATIKINYKRRKMESRGGCAERARSTLDKSLSKMKDYRHICIELKDVQQKCVFVLTSETSDQKHPKISCCCDSGCEIIGRQVRFLKRDFEEALFS
ncbi:unnamed protein product [Gongylonema pulchrum]|uniref:DUF3109 family protein n=1 Tax=Gongylonema pulchrum TaxID=637853 RepID=A0A183E1T6_9BILA|nr:unnamed protein product [Gongylonema pulchrum]